MCGGCAQDRGQGTQLAIWAAQARPQLCPVSCHCPMEGTLSNLGASCLAPSPTARPPSRPGRVAGRLGAGSRTGASPFVRTSWYDY